MGVAVLKAIGRELAEELSVPSTNNRNPLNTARSSSIIRRRFHPLGSQAALHSTAKTKVESVLTKVLELVDSDIKDQLIKQSYPMDEDDMETILDFAECIDPTKLFNCSVPTVNKFRSIDGTCNNLFRPLIGAANTQFRRVLPAQYEDGIS